MTTSRTALGLLAAAIAVPLQASPTVTPNYDNVDISRWRCRLCPFDLATGAQGRWRAGALVVDDAEARFGRHNGLDRAGARGNGSAFFARRDGDGRHLAVDGADLGLGNRQGRLRAGRDDRYDAAVTWRELPHNVATDGRTPYAGRTTLALPDAWTTPSGPGLLPATPDRAVDYATRRRRGHARLALMPTANVRLQASYAREAKTGTTETYADRFYQATGLPKPIDTVTDELGTEIVLTSEPWLVAAALRRSRFRNANASLAWQSAFSRRGEPASRIALAPGNDLDTATLASRARLGRTRFSIHANWGRHRQDETFLPVTTNAALDPAPLDADSLGGRVRTFAGTANLVSRLTARLRLHLKHRLHERADKTPRLLLKPVLGDLFETAPRPNRIYEVRRATTEAGLRYRPGGRARLEIGGRSVRAERSRLEIATNHERLAWIDLATRTLGGFEVSVKASRGERTASAFKDSTRNNPLTRRFYQAAREQRAMRIRVDNRATGMPVSLGAEVDLRVTRYPASTLGLTGMRDAGWGVDMGYAVAEGLSVAAFLESRVLDSTTAGRQAYPSTDWWYGTADDVRTAGLVVRTSGVVHADLDVTLTVQQSLGRGRYETAVADAVFVFPDLVSDHRSLEVEATYRWRPKTALIARWYAEDYRGADWALDDVAPTAIGNVLAFGRRSPTYANSYFGLALERRM